MPSKKKVEKKKLGWHFLPKDCKLTNYDGRKAEVGKTLSVPASLRIGTCSNGMHASEKIHDAAHFNRGPVLSRVEVWGDLDVDSEKFAGRHRKVLWMKELKEKDLIDCLAGVGAGQKADFTGDSQGALVARLATAAGNYPTKVDRWLENWAAKNGLNGGRVVVEYVKKPVTEAEVKKFLSNRLVRTLAEISKDMEGAYDVDADDESNESLEDVLDSSSDIIRVESYTEKWEDGYVLRLKRKR